MAFRAFRPVVDQDNCKRCGLCATYCPEGCIVKMDEDYHVDYRHCKGCGICSNECPSHVIKMAREGES